MAEERFQEEGESIPRVLGSLSAEALGELDEHPRSDELVDLAEGALDAGQEPLLRSHLLWCDDCSAVYFSLMDALICDRFWDGLRRTLKAQRRRPSTGSRLASQRSDTRKLDERSTSVAWTIEQGPRLRNGEFRVRLALTDHNERLEDSARVSLRFIDEVVEWDEAVQDGQIDCVRNFGPTPDDLLLRAGDVEALLERAIDIAWGTVSSENGAALHPLGTFGGHLTDGRRAKQAWKARYHCLRASEDWSALLAVDVHALRNQLFAWETNNFSWGWAKEMAKKSRSNDVRKKKEFEKLIDEWYAKAQENVGTREALERLRAAYIQRRKQAFNQARQCPRYASISEGEYYLLDDDGILVIGEKKTEDWFAIYTGYRPTELSQDAAYPDVYCYREHAFELMQDKAERKQIDVQWWWRENWDESQSPCSGSSRARMA